MCGSVDRGVSPEWGEGRPPSYLGRWIDKLNKKTEKGEREGGGKRGLTSAGGSTGTDILAQQCQRDSGCLDGGGVLVPDAVDSLR